MWVFSKRVISTQKHREVNVRVFGFGSDNSVGLGSDSEAQVRNGNVSDFEFKLVGHVYGLGMRMNVNR